MMICCCGAGPPTHGLPPCPCTAIPDTIYLHVAHVNPPNVNGLLFPAAISWQPKPADLAAYGAADPGYYSAKFTSSNGLNIYRYNFFCSGGLYYLPGVMTPDSPTGYQGGFIVGHWLIGTSIPLGLHNTCSPLQLYTMGTDSTTFAAQGVTIDGAGPP